MTGVDVTSTDSQAAYFVDRYCRLRVLTRLLPLAGAACDPREVRLTKERFAELYQEVTELRGRLGGAVRRKVNERLRELGSSHFIEKP